MGRRPVFTLVARKSRAFDPGNPIGFRTSRSFSTRCFDCTYLEYRFARRNVPPSPVDKGRSSSVSSAGKVVFGHGL